LQHDRLYIELRPLPSVRTHEIETVVCLDLGADGKPVGHDIQHTANKRDLVAQLVISAHSRAA